MEASELRLKKFILDELSKLNLKSVEFIDFSIDSFETIDSLETKFIIAIDQSLVDFVVDNEGQFKILSVLYNEKKYVDAEHLRVFEGFVADLVTIVRPVVVEKIVEYEKYFNTIDYREEQVRLKEEYLEKRTLEIQAREQLLEFQGQAFDVENEFIDNEKGYKMPKWVRENNFIFKWIGIIAVVALIILLLILIQG